jgi:hypothetical protein
MLADLSVLLNSQNRQVSIYDSDFGAISSIKVKIAE